ncbi:NAD(P)-dependent oxidoreductase [Tetragenococcus halophilus]|uniref:NAD(P)-dependent oxidoreductase n=1 Tax=Tetragenococcus halophilus TaxID=51669 RepID=UPI001031ADA0|nr:NAD(P)-dependent oxidoreductase [Tetragenococcus halophilus]MCO7026963.1 NAD(P)-dependent oxidoreductase [Tetragenococcus halophilus]GFK29319.1 3-hydroxyisobutyrate dehydrogenase [Tetragenococcus halophilus]GLL51786.1 dehydrogenase [Tetragenococcus halophilus]
MVQQKEMKTIAVLGTGIMGGPMASNLAKSGFAVHVWNRTRAKAEKLIPDGLGVYDTPQEAVKDTDAVLTVLKDAPTVLEAMNSAQENLSKDAIWIQMTTVGKKIDELIQFAEKHELTFFDAPVQGTKAPAESGELTVMPSGPSEYKEVLTPIFDVIGKKTIWVSEEAGKSSRLKLALNSWVFALTHGVAESLTIAKELGVDPQLVMDVITGGPMDTPYFQQKGKAILNDDYTASFAVKNAVKDAQLIVDAMEDEDLQIDITAAGLQRFQRALEEGHGDKDIAASGLAGKKEE